MKLEADVVKWSGIVFVDKELDIPKIKKQLPIFLNGRLKRNLREELFQDRYKNIYLCGSNASRCFSIFLQLKKIIF